MDLLGLIKERKSIRHFTTEVPSRETVLACLEAASWAPNPTSQQPWKFIVLTGEELKKTCRAIEENYATALSKEAEHSIAAEQTGMVQVLLERKDATFSEMLAFLKAEGVDLQSVGAGNFAFHHAPMGILFATYPCKDNNYLKSTVAAMQNFLLAATAQGLGTCWMNAVSICQEYIKAALKLSPELILVDGVAVGYPADGSALNQIPRKRLPIEAVTEWL